MCFDYSIMFYYTLKPLTTNHFTASVYNIMGLLFYVSVALLLGILLDNLDDNEI